MLRSKHVTGISWPYVYCGLASESSTAFATPASPSMDIIPSASMDNENALRREYRAIIMCIVFGDGRVRLDLGIIRGQASASQDTCRLSCWGPCRRRLRESCHILG